MKRRRKLKVSLLYLAVLLSSVMVGMLPSEAYSSPFHLSNDSYELPHAPTPESSNIIVDSFTTGASGTYTRSFTAVVSSVPTITQAWTSESIRGPEVTNFPAGTETVCVNYEYENPVGSVQKIVWHDEEETFSRTATHVAEHESGIGTWSLSSSVFLSGGQYIGDLFIDDVLLYTIGWTVQPGLPAVNRVWTSESIRGPELVNFSPERLTVFVNYDYVNPLGSLHKIIWYDSEGNAMGTQTHVSEHRIGTGTWGLTYPGGGFWLKGEYRAELFINDVRVEDLKWKVVQPPVLLVHGFQTGLNRVGVTVGFNLDEIWGDMAKYLTGKDVNDDEDYTLVCAGTQPCDPDELDFAMKRLDGNGFIVYISCYTHNTAVGTPQDIKRYAESLALEIELIKQTEGVSQLDIVAHSMGGLVSRAYIEHEDLDGNRWYRGDVRKLVMLGTPNHGSDFAAFFPDVVGWESAEQMEPDSEFLAQLNVGTTGKGQRVEYSAFAGNFYACEHINLYCLYHERSRTCWQAATLCSLVQDDNDSVVNVASVTLVEIPKSLWFVYGLEHSQLGSLTAPKVRSILLNPCFSEEPVPLPDCYLACLCSPGELRVFDSRGRTTGMLEGEIIEEIPDSVCDDETNTIIIFSEDDHYSWNVVGARVGKYELEISHANNGGMTTFVAIDIPITFGAIHQYSFDWAALGQGEDGATIRIDSDGDGRFERRLYADNELTTAEFRSHSFEKLAPRQRPTPQPVPEVEKPPSMARFNVTNLHVAPNEVTPNQPVNVWADITNVGNEYGLYDVVLFINNKMEGGQRIYLHPGENRRVLFQVSRPTPRTYNVSVSNQSGWFMVKDVAYKVVITPPEGGGSELGTPAIIAIVLGAVGVGIAILLARRRIA